MLIILVTLLGVILMKFFQNDEAHQFNNKYAVWFLLIQFVNIQPTLEKPLRYKAEKQFNVIKI